MRTCVFIIFILLTTSLSGCLHDSDDDESETKMKRPDGPYILNTAVNATVGGQQDCTWVKANQSEEDVPCVGVLFSFIDFYYNISEWSRGTWDNHTVGCPQGQDPLTGLEGWRVCHDDVSWENSSEFTFDGDEITIRGNHTNQDLRYAWITGDNVEELLVLKRTDSTEQELCKVYVAIEHISEDTHWNQTAVLFAGYQLPSWC